MDFIHGYEPGLRDNDRNFDCISIRIANLKTWTTMTIMTEDMLITAEITETMNIMIIVVITGIKNNVSMAITKCEWIFHHLMDNFKSKSFLIE